MSKTIRAFIIVAAVMLLAPAAAFAQGTGGSKIGLGVNATTAGDNLGLSVPIDLGSAFRIEPGLYFSYQRQHVEGTNGNTQTETTTGIGFRLGLHSFFAQAGGARAFLGGDLAFAHVSATQRFETNFGNLTNTTESDTTANGFTVAPVLGGEVGVAGGLHLGVRAGPQFAFIFPEVDDDNVESASIFAINGYGRIDAIYYF